MQRINQLFHHLTWWQRALIAVVITALAVLTGTQVSLGQSATEDRGEQVVLPTRSVQLAILPEQPGGPTTNWPTYFPSLNFTVPANTLITVTIDNYDLGGMPMPNFPFATVTGTSNGMAAFNGQPLAALPTNQIAHTFTISQLNVNVPVPAIAPAGQPFAQVTFTFKSPSKPGEYQVRCMMPCGTGRGGWSGPMATDGWMQGTMTVAG